MSRAEVRRKTKSVRSRGRVAAFSAAAAAIDLLPRRDRWPVVSAIAAVYEPSSRSQRAGKSVRGRVRG